MSARAVAAVVAGLILAVSGGVAVAGRLRLVVADVPYETVWQNALDAVAGYPLERAADQVIATGWREGPPEGEAGFERVAERVTLRVERFGEWITRVTVRVEARGWREGAWVPIENTEARERAVLERVAASGG